MGTASKLSLLLSDPLITEANDKCFIGLRGADVAAVAVAAAGGGVLLA